jgi:DNA-binding Lrp family transcriptional regulator
MDAAQRLLCYVRRKQFLIYAVRLEEAGESLARSMVDITSALRLSAAECLGIVHRLQVRGVDKAAPRLAALGGA